MFLVSLLIDVIIYVVPIFYGLHLVFLIFYFSSAYCHMITRCGRDYVNSWIRYLVYLS